MTHEGVVPGPEKAPEPRLMRVVDVLDAAKDVAGDRYDLLAALEQVSDYGDLVYPGGFGTSRIRAREYGRLTEREQEYGEDTSYLAHRVAELQDRAQKEKAEADELLSNINTKYSGKLYLRSEGEQHTTIQALFADDELTVWAMVEDDDKPQPLGGGAAEILIDVTKLEADMVSAVDKYTREQ